MQLVDLIEAVTGRGLVGPGDLEVLECASDLNPQVLSVVHDSRQVTSGSLFCCVPGETFDGHDFAQQAVEDGASALLVERKLDMEIAQVLTPSVRLAMGPLGAALLEFPSDSMSVVGITGTNGKTTVTQMLAAILTENQMRCATIGTLSGARTTPEGPELQVLLGHYRDEGMDAVVMEVSSHALDQHRVDGVRFRAGGFTNLSQDHLDYHKTMDAYLSAKSMLFEPARSDMAVINVDDPDGARLADRVSIPVARCSIADAEGLEMGSAGSTFRWRGEAVSLSLPGRFNVSNAVLAATLAESLGVAATAVAGGLSSLEAVAGRFERIDLGQRYLAAVDYAHTPDGLRKILEAARELTDTKVVLVFGAGGDRDRDKRPQMGRVASELADEVVLTTDNPRSEDPLEIMENVRSGWVGSAKLVVEPDRRSAIRLGVSLCADGDVLIVAGKGHETMQIVGEQVFPFDDRLELRDGIAQSLNAESTTEKDS